LAFVTWKTLDTYSQSYAFIFAVTDGQAKPAVMYGLHHLDNIKILFPTLHTYLPPWVGRRGIIM
jgi:hypothetical protein